MPNELWNQLGSRASGNSLSDEQHARLNRYLDLLIGANEKMNLTRIVDRASAEVLHIADSLTVLPHLPDGNIRIADVGSGGGVPGIPLAIARPDASFMLIESTKKKTVFLKQTIEALELENVVVSEWRAEQVGLSNSRETFDVAIARAVATMDWLAEWLLPLVRKGGKALAMKGARIVDELPNAARAIKLLGGGEPIVHPVELPGAEHHVIVEIPKITKTDKRLPRDPTFAKGKPLSDSVRF